MYPDKHHLLTNLLFKNPLRDPVNGCHLLAERVDVLRHHGELGTPVLQHQGGRCGLDSRADPADDT